MRMNASAESCDWLWKGGMMRVCLDLCCFNRPFDDQNQPAVLVAPEESIVRSAAWGEGDAN